MENHHCTVPPGIVSVYAWCTYWHRRCRLTKTCRLIICRDTQEQRERLGNRGLVWRLFSPNCQRDQDWRPQFLLALSCRGKSSALRWVLSGDCSTILYNDVVVWSGAWNVERKGGAKGGHKFEKVAWAWHSILATEDVPFNQAKASMEIKYIKLKCHLSFIKHSWSNGRIIAFQAIGPGSTPGGCTTSFSTIARSSFLSFAAST